MRRTPDSLVDVASFVRTLEVRQGFKIGCPEEIAFDLGFIDDAQLEAIVTSVREERRREISALCAEGPSSDPRQTLTLRGKKRHNALAFLAFNSLTLLVNIHKLIVYRGGALGTLRDRSAPSISDSHGQGFAMSVPLIPGCHGHSFAMLIP